MIHLVLLLPLCAGAALVAQVWLQGVCLLLQCSFSSFYKNTLVSWTITAVCAGFETD